MSKGNSWQHREAASDEERFGLLDNPSMKRYEKTPVRIDPVKVKGSKKGKLKALGITSGIGSMLVGARDLGFEIIGNLEWRDYYRFSATPGERNTFTENFPGAFMARGYYDIDDFIIPQIDFAAGHPECGRYSNLSFSVKGGTYQESRGKDVSDIPLFLQYIARYKPRFFLMDDLPASFDALPMAQYVELLPDYDLFPEWVSNWGYGNTQKYRNRMFIVGALKDEKFAFRAGEFPHTRVLKDDIGDLVDLDPDIPNHANVDPDYIPGRYVNMSYYGHRPSWEQIRSYNGDLLKNLPYFTPDGEEKIRPGTRSPNWDSFCPVLSGGFNPLHPIRRLPLSIRERARIQGFPDDFVFHFDSGGPYREVWEPYNSDGQRGIKQTGKAMPLQFCTYVAAQVKAHIEGVKFEQPTDKRIIKPNPKVDMAKREFMELSGYANWKAASEACWLEEPAEYYKPRRTSL